VIPSSVRGRAQEGRELPDERWDGRGQAQRQVLSTCEDGTALDTIQRDLIVHYKRHRNIFNFIHTCRSTSIA